MHNTVEQFLLGLADSLPQPLAHELGSMSWQQRIFETTAGAQGQGTRLGFYSDGLALPQKIAVEKFIKSQLEKAYPQALPLAVVFSRREKGDTSNAGAPRPNSPHHPAQGATQASSPPQDPNDKRRPIPGVKNIVAVASGKGGVGKSTVSVNLAVALHNQGYRVGLLDADIYGPSIPMMLGVDDDPQVNSANKIIPPQRYGLKIMSFGFFAPPSGMASKSCPLVFLPPPNRR